MSGPQFGRPEKSIRALDEAGTFADFVAARQRYFAHLRADTEVRRLNALWRLPVPSTTSRQPRGPSADAG
jgi:hypothetical protein